ncbi:tetratricopeptide repeat protein [Puteibacter caeruleilacunae]|nr:tetratricopeptide repeat protein [Puteibacter caeruleilacunae]
MRFILTVLFVISTIGVFAVPDQKIKKMADKDLVDMYNDKAKSFWFDDTDSTLEYAQKALDLSKAIQYKKGEAEALNNMGVGYYFSSDYDKVLEFYQRSLETYEDLGDKKRIANIGSLYYRLGKYEKAIENYKQSLDANLKLGDERKIAELLENIGDTYQNLGNYEKALSYYQQWYEILRRGENTSDLTVAVTKIADVYFYDEKYRKALVKYEELQSLYNLLNYDEGKASVLSNIALTYFAMDSFIVAENKYKEALELNLDLHDSYGVGVCQLNMANLYDKLDRDDEALELALSALNVLESSNENDLKKQIYKLLVELYEAREDYKNAFKYQKNYNQLSEFLFNEEKTSQMTNRFVVYELGQKKMDNENLTIQKENYQLRLEKQGLLTWRLIFGFTILIALVAVAVIVYSYFMKKKENENLNQQVKLALQKQDEQQQIIVHQASLSSLGELAAGIAHEINQPLQNISLSAESIGLILKDKDPDMDYMDQSCREILEDIQRSKDIVDHIRVFSYGQKEEISEEFSVNSCISDAMSMMERQYANHGILLDFDADEDIQMVLGNPHKLEQVVINLITNARDAVEEKERKSGEYFAKEIHIKTSNVGKYVSIDVKDNGVGISKEKQTDIFLPFVTSKSKGQGTGLGLSISHGIIKDMHGQIEVESESGKGTLMRILIPAYQNH